MEKGGLRGNDGSEGFLLLPWWENMGMGEAEAEAEAEADSSNISLHVLESYLALEHAYHRIQDDIVKFMVLLSHGLGLLRVMAKERKNLLTCIVTPLRTRRHKLV